MVRETQGKAHREISSSTFMEGGWAWDEAMPEKPGSLDVRVKAREKSMGKAGVLMCDGMHGIILTEMGTREGRACPKGYENSILITLRVELPAGV